MNIYPRDIQRYITPNAKIPFTEWFESLRDINAQARILSRLNRAAAGNLGNYRSVGEEVFELKIDYGTGYRIYFGQIGNIIILLLCGGDKSTQDRDIRQAQKYWKDYEKRTSTRY
jgi:putative addiction module killer protein